MNKTNTSYINCLRKELNQTLKERFPNKKGEIIIKKAARAISFETDDILKLFEKSAFDTEDKEEKKVLDNYLEKIDEERIVRKELLVSANTLNSFLYKVSVPKIEKLHTYALYLDYVGWYHFVDELNKRNIENNINDSPLDKLSRTIEDVEVNLIGNSTKNEEFEMTPKEGVSLQKQMNHLIDEMGGLDRILESYLPKAAKEKKLENLFYSIIDTPRLSISQKNTIEQYIGFKGRENGVMWYDRSLIATSLSISLIKHYDYNKANYLLDLILENKDAVNSDVWQRAIVGLYIALLCNYRNIDKTSLHKGKLDTILSIPENSETFFLIAHVLDDYDVLESMEEMRVKIKFLNIYRYFTPLHEKSEIFNKLSQTGTHNFNYGYFAKLISESVMIPKFQKYEILFAFNSASENEAKELFRDIEQNENNGNNYHYVLLNTIDEFWYGLMLAIKDDDVLLKKFVNIKNKKEDIVDFMIVFFEDYFTVGTLYEDFGDYSTALNYYLESEKENPGNRALLMTIGLCLQKLNTPEKAMDYYRKALLLEPENSLFLCQAGACLQELGDYEEALEYHLLSERINPKNTVNLEEIAICYQEIKNYSLVLQYRNKIDKISPRNPENIVQLAWCHFVLGNLDLALKHYLYIIENFSIEKGGMNIYLNLGHVYFAKNEINSHECYIKSHDLFADKLEFWDEMQDDFQYLEQYGITRKYYDQALMELKQKIEL